MFLFFFLPLLLHYVDTDLEIYEFSNMYRVY